MHSTLVDRLREYGIQPSAQRIAVADYVLDTDRHPSADEVWERVKDRMPMLSRATVYNTLRLFVRRGLVRELVLSPGRVVFDPHLKPHHHFVDDDTGAIEDVPWESIPVGDATRLQGYAVREYMVVMRGRKLGGPRAGAGTGREKKR